MPCSACTARRLPSKPNGRVTTPTVSAPTERATSAMTGAPPVPVPPVLPEPPEEAPPRDESVVPRPLANAVMRCLEKDPKWRWGSAADLAEALADIDLADTPAPTLDSIPPSIADDEQRVVAVLLASEVHDLPMLSAAVDEWGGQLIPIVGGAIGVFATYTAVTTT